MTSKGGPADPVARYARPGVRAWPAEVPTVCTGRGDSGFLECMSHQCSCGHSLPLGHDGALCACCLEGAS